MRKLSQLNDNLLFVVAVVGACAWLAIASLASISAQPVVFVSLYSMAFLAYYLGVCQVMKRQQIKHALILLFVMGLLF